MEGTAKAFVRSIPAGDAEPCAPAADLLDQYEAKFKPEAAGDVARMEVKDARQKESESVQQWHSRLHDLYTRAHPLLDAAAVQQERDLMDCFILGLTSPTVKANTWRLRPATWDACLATASNNAAGERILAQNTGVGGAQVKPEPGLFYMEEDEYGTNAVGRRGADMRDCWYCGKKGHISTECRKRKGDEGRGIYRYSLPGVQDAQAPAATPYSRKTTAPPRGRGGRGARRPSRGGRGSARGAKRGGGGKYVNSMEQPQGGHDRDAPLDYSDAYGEGDAQAEN
jgi:hypothetical protein